MRDAPYINDLWAAGGPFTGMGGKPHTIVTVQRPWSASDPHVRDGDEDHVIHPTRIAGNARSRGVPLRWFQKENNSQVEEIVPNVKSVSIDRSIDTAASSCTIQLYNQWMYDHGAVPADKQGDGNRHLSGFFTPTRGQYPDANVRWGHETNGWEDTLVPNAILRTYQGYGGHDKTLEECLIDGNLILTGIWLVDEVSITTDGMFELKCRDTGKVETGIGLLGCRTRSHDRCMAGKGRHRRRRPLDVEAVNWDPQTSVLSTLAGCTLVLPGGVGAGPKRLPRVSHLRSIWLCCA